MSDKPNCYECKHRRDLPGDTHSACMAKRAHVVGDSRGAARGWFIWPLNYDPVWLISCDSFEREQIEEDSL